ncbi:MAG TPA: LysR family transcriptional regulator [Solirubrobacteraceae bacterium]|nr:LysR family transcriptional regulator [Solirubrobacteraceae bacterium]
MLDARRLRVLYEVARHGSFSAAAEWLGYTQPAISRQVALLERETGTTLLERRPDGARLTDAGELLVRHAEAILARLQDAEEELGELLGMQSGRLRMSTLTSAASTIVPPAILGFRKRLPGVELSVSVLDPGGVVAALRAGEIDLALTNDESHFELAEIEAVHLFDEPLLIALPNQHPLAGRGVVDLSDLADERWMLGTTRSCPDASRFLRACHGAGFDPKIAFHNDDYTAILGFVAAGVGVAPVPEMVARDAPRHATICQLRAQALTRPILASCPAGYRPGPARTMLEILVEVSRRWVAKRPPDLMAA